MIPAQMYAKTYDAESYNCVHFTCDIWQILTGEDISDLLGIFVPKVGMSDSFFKNPKRRFFKKIEAPVSPCLVLITDRIANPHIGVYYRGGMIHIGSKIGVKFNKIKDVTCNFSRVRFYVKNNLY